MSMRARSIGLGSALACALVAGIVTLSSEAEELALEKGAVGLSEVGNAESTLTTAKVRDRHGGAIGTVHGLTRGADGEIKTVQVALDGTPYAPSAIVVALDARDLMYLPKPNVIVAGLTRAEAQAKPRLEQ